MVEKVIYDYILNKNKLNTICVPKCLWLTSIKDILNYIQSNGLCHNGQYIGLHSNYEEKIFVITCKIIDGKYTFYPICLSDLYNNGIFDYNGSYILVPRINDITTELVLTLSNKEVDSYRINLNGKFINDFTNVNENFITTPFIFKNPNIIILYLYKDNKEVQKLRLLNNIYSKKLISGVLTTYLD